MSGDILKFPEKPETPQSAEQRGVTALLQQLIDADKAGELTNLVFTYTDKEGTVVNGINSNMSVRDFAFHVAVLNERLMRWIDQS